MSSYRGRIRLSWHNQPPRCPPMTLTSSYSPSGEVPSWTVPAWSLWPIEYSGINSVWFTRPDHKRLLTLEEAGGGGLVTKPCLTLATPWTVARQTPLSVGFSRQEYWSGLPCPSPGDLPNPGIEPRSPACRHNSLPTEPPGPCRGFMHAHRSYHKMKGCLSPL